MKNKYVIRSRISEAKFREILHLFCLDIEAKKIAEITGISRPSINKFFLAFRQIIATQCEASSPLGNGEIELDESYFGAKRVRGKRGRGAMGKIPVFGMKKREGRVYTQIVRNVSKQELMPIIMKNATLDSTGFKAYDGLADYGYKWHYRINHSANEFAKGRNHVNGIESFWGYCKVRLARFRGIHHHHFYYHLKECEFRFNHRGENMYLLLLKIIRKSPLKLS